MSINLITFLDHVGRTMLAEQVSLSETTLVVKNPVILDVQLNQNQQLNIQTVPLYFREFLGFPTRETGTVWSYPVASIVIGQGIVNDPKLVQAYERLWNPLPVQPQVATGSPKVVKLFDDITEESK